MGLLDLPAPLLDLLDAALGQLGLSPLVRVLVYAAASGWLSMAIYRRCSRQSELAELGRTAAILRRELAGYDGPFDGLVSRIRCLLRLNMKHLRLSLVPALLAGLPLLGVLPWLSNHFELEPPLPGSSVQLRPVGLTTGYAALKWSAPGARWDEHQQAWHLDWPSAGEAIGLAWNDIALLQIPLTRPATVVHKRLAIWNMLVANPAGYLPPEAPMDQVVFDFRPLELHPFGPSWLRGWLGVYLIAMMLCSLILRWKWKLH